MIDLPEIFQKAIAFYSTDMYLYGELPEEILLNYIKITCPDESKIQISDNGGYLIGSGEQTFLRKALSQRTESRELLEGFPYMGYSYCYRPTDEGQSPYHVGKFLKLEFFQYEFIDSISVFGEVFQGYISDLHYLMKSVKKFYTGLGIPDITTVSIPKEEHSPVNPLCESLLQYDIYSGDIEIGSYGIRTYDGNFLWAYGTLLTDHRINLIMENQKTKGKFVPSEEAQVGNGDVFRFPDNLFSKEIEKPIEEEQKEFIDYFYYGASLSESDPTESGDKINSNEGYHLGVIPKGKLGEISKITEEYLEFVDSVEQGAVVMGLLELSDLLGAIESYISKFNMSLDDLKIMKDLTARAFTNGTRG